MKSKFIVFPLLCLLSTTLTGCIKDDIKALNEMDNHLQEQIDALNEEIEDLKNQINKLKEELETTSNEIKEDYLSRIAAVESEIEILRGQIQELTNQFEEDKETITNDYNQKISNLQTFINGKIAEINARIQEDEQALSNLEAKHDNDVAALEEDYNNKLSQLDDDLETTKEELEADYNTKLDALDEEYSEQVANLQTQISNNKAAIDSFKNQYLSEKAALELDYNTKISNLRTEYENKVAELEQSILEKGNAITALQNEMNEALIDLANDYNAKINSLVERVSILESKTYHTVIFDTLGGTNIEPVLIEHGEKVSQPIDPVRQGYTFKNWTYESVPWVFIGYVVTENMTLVADYDVIRYSISYNLDGGIAQGNNPSSYTIEDEITFAEPSKMGFNFAGWFDDNNNQVVSIPKGTTGELRLTAHWSANLNNLSVTSEDTSKGTVEIVSGVGYSNESITVSATPAENYIFGGWYNGTNKVSDDQTYTFIMPTSDYSLVAKWSYVIDVAGTYVGSVEQNMMGTFTCILSLGNEIAHINVPVNIVPHTTTTYTYNQETGIITIDLNNGTNDYGTFTGTYDPITKSIVNAGIDGGNSSGINNNHEMTFTRAAHQWNCDVTTEELQATFKRRYMVAGAWNVDADSADRIVSVNNSISGFALQRRGWTGGAVALNLNEDLDEAVGSSFGFWVYNPSSTDISLRMWGYKSTNFGSNFEMSSVTAKANSWTYCYASLSGKIYNFQIGDFTNSGVDLIFDNIVIY